MDPREPAQPIVDIPPPPGGVYLHPTSHRRRPLVIAAVVVAVLAVGGGAAAFVALRGSSEQLTTKLPAGTDAVVTVYLDPSAAQKVDLFRLAGRFPALGSETQLKARFNDAITQPLQQLGLTMDDLGWVGSQVAVAVDVPGGSQPPTVALVAAANDPAAAAAALAKLQSGPAGAGLSWTTHDHDGVKVWVGDAGFPGAGLVFAVVDDTVVLSSGINLVNGVIDTVHGAPSLAGDPAFQATTAGLPTDRLALGYVNVAGVVEAIAAGQGSDSPVAGALDSNAIQGYGMTVSAESDGFAVDMVAAYDPAKLSDGTRGMLSAADHADPLLSMVPSDAYGVFAQEHLDLPLEEALKNLQSSSPAVASQLDTLGFTGPDGVVSALTGDIAFTVDQGPEGGSPTGALLIGGNDGAKMQQGLDRLVQLLPPSEQPFLGAAAWSNETYKGVEITYLDDPTAAFAPAYGVVDDSAVVAFDRRELHRIIDTARGGADITTTAGYRDGLRGIPTSDGVAYVDLATMLNDVRAAMPDDVRADFDANALPNLRPFRSFAMGTTTDETHQYQRLVVRVG